jgi:hypothetical protein
MLLPVHSEFRATLVHQRPAGGGAAMGVGSAGRVHSGGDQRVRRRKKVVPRAFPLCPAPAPAGDPRAASSASPVQWWVPGGPEGAGEARRGGAGQAGTRWSNRGGVVVSRETVQLNFGTAKL